MFYGICLGLASICPFRNLCGSICDNIGMPHASKCWEVGEYKKRQGNKFIRKRKV